MADYVRAWRKRSILFKGVLVGCSLILLGVISGVMEAEDAHGPSFKIGTFRPADLKAQLIPAIEQYGPLRTREGLVAALSAHPSRDDLGHLFLHVFGETLYETEGVRGISSCDTSFAFGCYHGFSIRAIEGEGLGILPELASVCREEYGDLYGPCEHGLGHGVASVFGPDDLAGALDECVRMGTHPSGGCRTGVFMEYNLPTNPDHTGTGLRPLDTHGYLYPCDAVAPEHQPACYTNQPQWWLELSGGDFASAGARCGTLEGELKSLCYAGVGNQAPIFGEYHVDRTIASCAAIPSREGVMLCSLSAAEILLIDGGEESARKMCESLPVEDTEVCFKRMERVRPLVRQ